MDRLYRQSLERLARGSQSFAQAARLFPPAIRRSATLLYAFCRHCDDALDGQSLGLQRRAMSEDEQRQAYQALAAQVDHTLTGDSGGGPAFAALHDVVTRHRVPHGYVRDLLHGMAMDIGVRRFETLTDTLAYCYHVAGVVGLMMATIFGVRDEDTLHRATDRRLAFQLTNIARDVAEDLAHGMVYLPQEWLHEAGLPPDASLSTLSEAGRQAVVTPVVRRLLRLADDYYASARVGAARLPPRIAWAILSALAIYRAIGMQVIAQGDAGWTRRARVSSPRKLGFILTAAGQVASGLYRKPPAQSRAGLWTRGHAASGRGASM